MIDIIKELITLLNISAKDIRENRDWEYILAEDFAISARAIENLRLALIDSGITLSSEVLDIKERTLFPGNSQCFLIEVQCTLLSGSSFNCREFNSFYYKIINMLLKYKTLTFMFKVTVVLNEVAASGQYIEINSCTPIIACK